MPDPLEMTALPKEIVLVMRAIGRIAKDAKNAHGGYKYTSVDAFLEATSAACSEAGLIVKPVQMACSGETLEVWDKDGRARQRRVMRFAYRFRLIHETGLMWTDPDDERAVVVDYTGPQTFQAAESFALKAYMRTLFQIPTGDPDADAQEQHQAEIIRATVKAARAKKESGAEHVLFDFGAGLEPVTAADLPDRVMQHLIALGDPAVAAEWWRGNAHGREQFGGLAPRLALELKRKVERFIAGAEAAE
jgi:hypothetical protein